MISAVFDQPGAGFVLLPPGQKFPPSEKAWQNNPHSFTEAAAHKNNIGLLAGNDYIGLDQDDPHAFEGLELPPTTTWETRPGRVGMLFRCSDVPDGLTLIGKKPDLAQIKLFEEGWPVGEIKLRRSYQVIPPSWKEIDGQRVDYKLLQEIPPANISLVWLLQALQKIGISFTSKLEQNASRLESNVSKGRKERALTDDQRARRYGEAALEDEAAKVASAAEGSRNDLLNKATFAMAQFIGARVLSESEVVRELTKAARLAGLPNDEIESTIRSGLQAGLQHPREIPEWMEENAHPPMEVVDPEITAVAMEVLQHGYPIQCIADSCGRVVLGAETAFKKLCCCVAVQDINQSEGLHPKLNGDSGSGKSLAVLTFAHHLPSEAVVKGSSSNLAGFYHQDGDRLFRILDDYQAGNDSLDTIIKQTSTVFHQSYEHRTVVKQKPVTLEIGSEQTWAITSVDSDQDIQVLNRQLTINVDDSRDLTRKVNTATITRYGKGEVKYPEDQTVLVCREIWRILRSEDRINVRVPFFERIEWLDVSNRRNPSLFMDLLIAHTAMNRFQREKDSDGFYLATEADFQAAKALFTDKDAEELIKRLTTKEREAANLLATNQPGLTRDEIAGRMSISPNRVTQILKGQKGQGGLCQKLPIKETRISETLEIDREPYHARSIHKTVYSLDGYDQLSGFDAVVRLKPATGEPGKQGKQEVSSKVSKQIDNSSVVVSKVSIDRENERELTSSLDCPSLSETPKDTYFAYFVPTDSESKSLPEAYPSLPCLPDAYGGEEEILTCRRIKKAIASGITDPIKLAEVAGIPVCIAAKWPGVDGEVVLSRLEEHRGGERCAVCGVDLEEKGRVERNGKIYCARPGCGYSERAVEVA